MAKLPVFISTFRVRFEITTPCAKNWRVIVAMPAGGDEFRPGLFNPFISGENFIDGNTLRGLIAGNDQKRVRIPELCYTGMPGSHPAGLLQAEAMLREQEKIPGECEPNRLVFLEAWDVPPGTVVQKGMETGPRFFTLYHSESGGWGIEPNWVASGLRIGDLVVGVM